MPSHPTDALWDRDEPSLPIQAQMHVCEQNRWLLSLYAIKWFVSYAATPKEASGGVSGGTGSLDNKGQGSFQHTWWQEWESP